jgi:hypothetical protein
MIVFGTAVSDADTYRRIALPGIERVAEEDSVVLTRTGYDSIQRPYNEMMEEAAAQPDLEALVLLHQDLGLADEDLLSRTRRVFAEPRTGLLGALGGRGTRLHCWLAPDEMFGFALGPDHMEETIRISTGRHEVDGVDGALLILAPWVVRSLHFDESLAGCFHGYDVDLSARVRAAGGRVICEDIACRHHARTEYDHEALQAAGVAVAKMWDPTLRPREWGPAFQR